MIYIYTHIYIHISVISCTEIDWFCAHTYIHRCVQRETERERDSAES